MDPAQIVLIVVVVVLTLLLCVIGGQLYFILREVRESLQRINSILEQTENMTSSVARPVRAIGEGLAHLAILLGSISRFLPGGKKDVR